MNDIPGKVDGLHHNDAQLWKLPKQNVLSEARLGTECHHVAADLRKDREKVKPG
jgi:ribosomal protein S1